MKKIILLTLTISTIFLNCEPKNQEVAQQISDIESEQIVEQQEVKPTNNSSDVEKYIPKGYQILQDFYNQPHLVKGDFNNDNIEDFAVTITDCEDSDCNYFGSDVDVRLVIFQGNNSGFVEKNRSENISELIDLDYHALNLEKNVIILTAGFRYTKVLKFRYENKYNDYMLIGSEQFTSGNSVLLEGKAGTISTNYLTGVRLINFNKYDEEKGSVVLPEKKEKVSKQLKSLSEISNSNYDDL